MARQTLELQEHLTDWGLHAGQVRARRVARDCQWYDRFGNQLGFGDLNAVDLRRIAAALGPEDLFVAVEAPSLPSPGGDLTTQASVPAAELVNHSTYAITQGRVCRVVDCPEGITVLDGQLLLWPLTREALRHKLLLHKRAAEVTGN
jgi:hypothetical protein